MALSPLKPVPTTGAYSVGLIMAPQALPILEREVSRVTSGVYDLRSRPVDEEHVGALLTVPRALDRQVGVLLAEIGVEEVTLPAPEKGQPYHRSLLRMLERGREIPGDIAAVENRIGDLGARWGPALHAARRGAEDRLGEIRAMARCGETEHAFVLTGYLPREQVPQLSNAVNEAFRGQVAVLGSAPLREEYGEVPVVLRNPRLLKPFELLLSLVPLPRYGSIDPTPLLAVFYPLFFGLIIGDAGFGVIALALASLAHRRRWGGRMGRQMASVALACAISTLIFGFLYGEIFGLGSQIGLHPILLDRRRAFMTFLVAAVVLGGAHVAMGLVLGFFDSARNRRLREAITRAAQLTLLLCIAALLVVRLGALPSSMHDWTLAALAASAVVGVAAGGPMLLLEVLMSVGNVLSYARLMALGLASVLLAEAANRVATAVKPAAIALFIAVILHLTNFTLGLISPIVNALRLHYVEFFEKFYEPGGRPYRPFALSA
jgi:V/A-type H+-transporting ATPase subunit I